MKVRVAAAQIRVTSDVEQNLSRILTAVKDAASRKARFVCLPEACLVVDDDNVPSIDAELKKIRRVAKERAIHVIFGSYAKINGHVRNQVFVISADGSIVYRYSKRNVFMKESALVKPGRSNKVLSLDGVVFAVINCWDYAFPEQFRVLAKKGAKIIFCPAYLLSHPRTKNVLVHVPQVRAFDTMAYFVMADAVSEETFCQTTMCHPLRRLARVSGREGLLVQDLDLSEITALRKEFPNF